MMSDLIERLRRGPSWDYDGYKTFKLMQEAADALEAKDKRIAELEEALKKWRADNEWLMWYDQELIAATEQEVSDE